MNNLYFVDVQPTNGKETVLRRTPLSSITEDFFQSCLSPNACASSVFILCVHENTQFTFSIRGLLSFCNRCIVNSKLIGRTFWINQGFLIFILDNPLQSESLLQQQAVSILNKLRHKLGVQILYYNYILCAGKQEIKNKLEPALVSMLTMQYYGLSTNITARNTPSEQQPQRIIQSLMQKCELGQLEDATQVLRGYVQDSHKNRKPPDEIKSDVIRILYFLTAVIPYTFSHADCHPISFDIMEDILQSTSYRQTECIIDQFCRDYVQRYQPIVEHVPEPIRNALQYMKENYQHSLRLFEVAQVIHLNKSYFSQLFQKTLGVSYSEYLESLRINAAKKLLKETDKSTAEISEIVGFSSQNYFAKVFKDCVGISPSQFRSGKIPHVMCR